MADKTEEQLLPNKARTAISQDLGNFDDVGREHAANNGKAAGPATVKPWGNILLDHSKDFSEDLYAVLIDRTEGEVIRRLIGTYDRATHAMRIDGDAGLNGILQHVCMVHADNRTQAVRTKGGTHDPNAGKVR